MNITHLLKYPLKRKKTLLTIVSIPVYYVVMMVVVGIIIVFKILHIKFEEN